MAQSKDLLRFRARLKAKGYTDISIRRAFNMCGVPALNERQEELWFVRCTEPLLGYEANFVCAASQMNNWPGIYLDRNGYFQKQLDYFEDCIDENILFEDGDGFFV